MIATIWSKDEEKIYGNCYGFVLKDREKNIHPMGPTLKMIIKRLDKIGRKDISEVLKKMCT